MVDACAYRWLGSWVGLLVFSGSALAQAEGPPQVPRVFWDNGFRVEHQDLVTDTRYTLRVRAGLQPRYTIALTDGRTQGYKSASTGERPGNAEPYNALSMRRLRFFVDGSAPTPAWSYNVHVQLEPQSGVNVPDAVVRWQASPALQVQVGRMKIPAMGVEFLQSGFMQNGTDRTIFTGDSENDKDLFGTRTYDFPSGNARLRVGGHRLRNGFPTGGLMLYRSQGVQLRGMQDLLGRKQLLAYSLGVFNGRDTRAWSGPDAMLLTCARLGLNFLPGSDPKGPLGPQGLANYTMQGDHGYNTSLLGALVASAYWDGQQAPVAYVPDPDAPGFMSKIEAGHETQGYGGSLALLFRLRGISLDLEVAREAFLQGAGEGGPPAKAAWERWGGRLNLGAYLVPRTLEATAKLAYLERLLDNDLKRSLHSGLGLVQRAEGWGVEAGLTQVVAGLNYYLHGFNQYLSADVAWMQVRLNPVSATEARRVLGMSPATSSAHFPSALTPENDVRVRVMYQQRF